MLSAKLDFISGIQNNTLDFLFTVNITHVKMFSDTIEIQF